VSGELMQIARLSPLDSGPQYGPHIGAGKVQTCRH
jgi:hypothetical protein